MESIIIMNIGWRKSFRLGQLKAGDRILAMNGISLQGVTLHTAIKLANEMKEYVTMMVEFDVEGRPVFLTLNIIHICTFQIQ